MWMSPVGWMPESTRPMVQPPAVVLHRCYELPAECGGATEPRPREEARRALAHRGCGRLSLGKGLPIGLSMTQGMNGEERTASSEGMRLPGCSHGASVEPAGRGASD